MIHGRRGSSSENDYPGIPDPIARASGAVTGASRSSRANGGKRPTAGGEIINPATGEWSHRRRRKNGDMNAGAMRRKPRSPTDDGPASADGNAHRVPNKAALPIRERAEELALTETPLASPSHLPASWMWRRRPTSTSRRRMAQQLDGSVGNTLAGACVHEQGTTGCGRGDHPVQLLADPFQHQDCRRTGRGELGGA